MTKLMQLGSSTSSTSVIGGKLMSLFDNIRSEAGHLLKDFDPEFQSVAALVWRDAKTGSVQIGARDLDALKDLAAQVVSDTENDPAFKKAAGSWKLGYACMMLMAKLGRGSFANIPTLAQDTAETLIQTTFASMVTHS
jgi:hypothetical protein